jgi:hypothetical protein
LRGQDHARIPLSRPKLTSSFGDYADSGAEAAQKPKLGQSLFGTSVGSHNSHARPQVNYAPTITLAEQPKDLRQFGNGPQDTLGLPQTRFPLSSFVRGD